MSEEKIPTTVTSPGPRADDRIMEPWWSRSTVYEVYLRSFADADGDGFGDLDGLCSRLSHIRDLGADIIWVTPFYRSPQRDNGYDIADYDAIDPIAGDDTSFDALVHEAHDLGLKIMIDVVLNHTSDQHPWFRSALEGPDSPHRDWYIWRPSRPGFGPGESGAEPTNWLGFFAEPTWTHDETSDEYYLHLFARQQPDLNWENPEVRAALFAMLRRWVDRGVDGFRMDVINLISKRYPLSDVPATNGIYGDGTPEFANGPRLLDHLREMKREVLDYAEERNGRPLLTVGEMPGATIEVAQSVTGGDSPLLDMIFTFEHMNFDHAPGWTGRYCPRPADLPELKEILARWQEGLAPSGWNSLYFGNHDQARILSRLGSTLAIHREDSAKTLATVLHLHRGTPYLYQGDEIGMANYPFTSFAEFADVDARNSWAAVAAQGGDADELLRGLQQNGRDNARTPMQWDSSDTAGFTTGTPWFPVNPDHRTVNVTAQAGVPGSVMEHVKTLISLRKRHDIVAEGTFTLLAARHPSCWAFVRELKGERWLVVANLSDTTVDLAEVLGQSAPGAEDTMILGTSPSAEPTSPLQPWESRILRSSRSDLASTPAIS